MAIDNCHLDYVRALGRDAEGREPEIGGGHRAGPRPDAKQPNYDRREALRANGTLVIFMQSATPRFRGYREPH